MRRTGGRAKSGGGLCERIGEVGVEQEWQR